MLNRLQLFRNVGQFDSVNAAANLPLSRLTFIYAENGRGKTTLAAILRSLGTNNPIPINERRRLTAANPPHVVLDCAGGPAVFQNGAWSRALPDVVVFDDVFVDENVYSGLAVEPDHRARLHELILGSQGVALSRALQTHASRIDQHNRDLRVLADAIPAAARSGLNVDDFCALPERPDIDNEIDRAERALAAADQQGAIAQATAFELLSLPRIDLAEIEALLARDLPDLDAAAAEQVSAHLESIGDGGQAWVSDGMHRLPANDPGVAQPCPFCTQDLRASPIIEHYRAFFGENYTNLKAAVARSMQAVDRAHGGDAAAVFERQVRTAVERRQFWERFCEVPALALDTAAIAHVRRTARERITGVLQAKAGAPLERLPIPAEVREMVAALNAHCDAIDGLNAQLEHANRGIALVKEQAAAGNRNALAADVTRLKATRARHELQVAAQCTAYLTEKAAKTATEGLRDAARADLDNYRAAVFPAYQAAINDYLQRFNAGFRITDVASVNNRQGSSCTYNVLINNVPVEIAANAAPGAPSFRNTLSAGDRNTLALAFFFASIDRDPGIAQKVVVIDDPITSLDDHRSLATIQQVRLLSQRVAQVVVLSHSKPFLCRLWEGTDTAIRMALEVARDGAGSTIRSWDVNQDCVTEHDRHHAVLSQYVQAQTPNNRAVATAIRPVLEAYCRVAYPGDFPPGTVLGNFINICQQRVGHATQIMAQVDIDELRAITEYGNRFHHNTNPAYMAEHINDAELLGFVQRSLRYTRR